MRHISVSHTMQIDRHEMMLFACYYLCTNNNYTQLIFLLMQKLNTTDKLVCSDYTIALHENYLIARHHVREATQHASQQQIQTLQR